MPMADSLVWSLILFATLPIGLFGIMQFSMRATDHRWWSGLGLVSLVVWELLRTYWPLPFDSPLHSTVAGLVLLGGLTTLAVAVSGLGLWLWSGLTRRLS